MVSAVITFVFYLFLAYAFLNSVVHGDIDSGDLLFLLFFLFRVIAPVFAAGIRAYYQKTEDQCNDQSAAVHLYQSGFGVFSAADPDALENGCWKKSDEPCKEQIDQQMAASAGDMLLFNALFAAPHQ